MKKALAVTAALGALIAASGPVYAATTDVGASVNVGQTALALTTLQEIEFGSFDITSANASGSIAINGSNQVTPNISNGVYDGGHTRGLIRAAGTAGAPVNFTCSTSATLYHGVDPTQSMTVSAVGLGGTLCSSGIISSSIGSTGIRDVGVFGTLEFTNPITGTYNTANGGTPITVEVLYQ